MPLEIAISVLSFASVGLFLVGVTMKSEHAIVRDRMASYKLSLPEDYGMLAPELNKKLSDRVFRPWMTGFTSGLARLMPSGAAAAAEAKLEKAGRPFKLSGVEYQGLRTLSTLIFGGAGIAFFLLAKDMVISYRLVGLAAGVVIGMMLPEHLLDSAVKARHTTIRKSLPDTMDLLVVSAEAGLGFDAAVARVVEKVRGPISEEFGKVLDEMRIGRSRVEALKSMASRVSMVELTTFAAAIYQADVLGVGIAHVLRVQAETLRSQRNLRAREMAAKLPVKLLFPLVFFIFPAIFVVLLGPGAISIFQALGSTAK